MSSGIRQHWDEVRELTRVRVLLFVREPEALFWVLVFPLILTAVLGYAFREGGVGSSRIGVLAGVDAALRESLEGEAHVEVELVEDEELGRRQLFRGALDALVLSHDTVALDPDREAAVVARLRVERAVARQRGAPLPELDAEDVRQRGGRYVDFLFPGILGMNVMGTGIWGISMAIADVRRRKLLKRLVVTPMRRSSFLVSFMLSRLAFLVGEVAVLLAFGTWVLGVPLRGSFVELVLLCLLGAFTFAALGLLIAARTRTTEGAAGLINLTLLPMWLGSGVFFSYERFPDAVQPVLKLLPLTPLNDGFRALMLDGRGLASLGPELLVLGVWAAVCFAVTLRVFRWE